ncbi:MAG: hypothetical protein JJT89_13510 [Nitriliruptoraceae bacterium]|nr:hypothetical protein [Nitriliruptoraceae bacterium]
MAEPDGWYVDEDLLDVYRVLKSARRNVDDVHGPTCLCDVCPERSKPDLVWFPMLAEQNWAILTHDGYRRPGERQAVVEHGLRVFVLRWSGSLKSFERVKLVFRKWDDMIEVWDREPAPFLYRVSRHQAPQPVDLI